MKKTDIDHQGPMPVFKLEIQGLYDKEKVTFLTNNLELFVLIREKLWEVVLGSPPPPAFKK